MLPISKGCAIRSTFLMVSIFALANINEADDKPIRDAPWPGKGNKPIKAQTVLVAKYPVNAQLGQKPTKGQGMYAAPWPGNDHAPTIDQGMHAAPWPEDGQPDHAPDQFCGGFTDRVSGTCSKSCDNMDLPYFKCEATQCICLTETGDRTISYYEYYFNNRPIAAPVI